MLIAFDEANKLMFYNHNFIFKTYDTDQPFDNGKLTDAKQAHVLKNLNIRFKTNNKETKTASIEKACRELVIHFTNSSPECLNQQPILNLS